MKNLSIEQKAKAYDKALAIARNFYNSTEYAKSHAEVKAIYEAIFPELAESEDERIKEDLIQWINEFPDTIWRGHYKKDVIAWLEKQGEQHNKVQVGEKYKCINSPVYTCFMKNVIYEVKSSFVASLIDICSDCFELVTEEKTPVDKPKFKVGQTIKKEGFNLGFTIVKIEDGFYYNDMGDNFPFTDQDNWELVEQKPAWSKEDYAIKK